ncbi:MAG: S41 family peptidase [Alistipes sp.]|jgi:carboxyl-terminal processing protease|nr:S41 family peptidase [Alistipes sp.]
MKIRKRYAIWGATMLAAVAALGVRAAYPEDFKLGQNVELVVNTMRSLFMYYVDPVDPTTLGKNAAAGMLSTLDPYTELIHADDSGEFELMISGKYGGIGSIIRQKGEWVQIAEPYLDSPADRAGLEIGDTFLEVEGRDARGMTTAEVSAILKGDAGTTVTIRVRKFLTGEERTLEIRREVIALPAVPYYGMLQGGVGYILHTEFTDGSADVVRSAFADLKAQGATSLVIDLRSNGGGIMQEAVKIVSMFVPRGTEVVSMRGRGEGTDREYRTESEPLDLEIPIAVLVDGNSASAAEIVAGALQDLDRGVVVGQRTFGKGLVQNTLDVGFGSYLKVTTAKYYIPSGRCIQAIDYSQAAEDEGAERRSRYIPDSLINEFRTAGGRRVYDGGGVMPDVRLDPRYNSRFAIVAYSKGYIDDFADRWETELRDGRGVTPRGFALTDGDYAAFAEFMADKDLGYESATGRTLDALRRNAEYERYMTDEVRALLDSLGEALRDDDIRANLEIYRTELSELIEDAIVLRHHHSRGVTEHNLTVGKDAALAAAVGVLGDGEEYGEILASRDTEKK